MEAVKRRLCVNKYHTQAARLLHNRGIGAQPECAVLGLVMQDMPA
jgi:hypothetical protein